MLSAEAAVLAHLKTIRIVLFVFDGVIIALLAFRAGQYDLYSLIRCHNDTSYIVHGRPLLVRDAFFHNKSNPYYWADLIIIMDVSL